MWNELAVAGMTRMMVKQNNKSKGMYNDNKNSRSDYRCAGTEQPQKVLQTINQRLTIHYPTSLIWTVILVTTM